MRALLIALLFVSGLQAQTVEELIAQGDALDAKLQNREAVEFYLKADQLKPRDAEILQRIAKEYGLSMNDVSSKEDKRALGQKALNYAKQAVAADARNANAQLALSISYGRLAEIADNKTKIAYARFVKEHAEESMKLNPSNDLPYFILAEWNYGLSNLNPVVRALAGAIYGQMPAASNEEAILLYRKALQRNPNRIGTRLGLGKALTAAGDKEGARKELEKAVALPNREKDDASVKKRAQEALAKL